MDSVIGIIAITTPIWGLIGLGAVMELRPEGRVSTTLVRFAKRCGLPVEV